jgi:Gas vesicle synthesis protein GvpL/GvpF
MAGLYVFALLRAPSGGDERPSPELTLVSCGGIDAAVVPVSAAPAVDADALRSHDAVVRRLCARSSSVLPMRFGSLVVDEAALRQWVESVRPILERGLEIVAGREQMVVRIYGDLEPTARDEDETVSGTLGTRYLRQRLPAMPRALTRTIESVRERLGALVLGERVERHQTPPLLVTLRHLVPRNAGDAYRAALEGSIPGLGLEGGKIEISGPWPPYAFTPEELS